VGSPVYPGLTSVVKVGLEWILALMPCPALVASGLLYFLFIVATRGRVALVALVVVVPSAPVASSRDATDRRGFAMALKPRGRNPSGRHWMLPIELHKRAGSDTAVFISEDWVGVVELGVLLLRWCQSAYGTHDPRLLQKRCLDPLVRERDAVRCACVGRAWRSLPT
jgi:hypothetical protein